MSNQNKVFKNPNRAENSQYQPYVPQYKLLDIEPIPMNMPNGGENSFITRTGPKQKFTPSIIPPNKPFAEAGEPQRGNVNGKFPNIGHNSDLSWSSLDSLYMDEYGNEVNLNQGQKFIDNNNYYPEEQIKFNKNSSLEEYVLFIDHNLVSTGSLEKVENEVKQLVFNEHKEFRDIDPESISVFKKMTIKIGVFLKE